ncbi:MAG: alpha/beta hydrolase [Rhodospirillaceae bacterium]|nr:alpha/beta hydrolase [Rhodospirillaceae bacterium]
MTVPGLVQALLARPDGHTIAYDAVPGAAPTIVFLHGLKSDRGGTKADALVAHCAAKGYGFVRFDMFGHGQSSGAFEDGTITRWVDDALAVIDRLTQGPLVLIGSSMGGWVGLKAAMARSERLAGFIGIAAAPDFTEDLMWAELSDAQKDALMREGFIELPSEYDPEPYRINRALIEDGRKNLVLRDAIPIHCPVRLLHGQQDTSVPWQIALSLAETLEAPDVQTILVKDGDHRLSRPQDLKRLTDVVDDLIAQVRG